MDHEGASCVLGYSLSVSVPAIMNDHGSMDEFRHDEIMALIGTMRVDLEAQAVGRVTYHGRDGFASFEATWYTWRARELAAAYLNLLEPGCSLRKFYSGGY
jgi:hypothetical protein